MSSCTPLLVFQSAGHGFALGLDHVRSVVAAVETTPLPGAPEGVLGFFDLRGDLVPVLAIPAGGTASPRAIGVDDRFVVVDTGRRVVALVAESVQGVEAVVVEPLSRIDGMADGQAPFAGVCRVAEGLVLIHDVERFLTAAQDATLASALASALESALQSQPASASSPAPAVAA